MTKQYMSEAQMKFEGRPAGFDSSPPHTPEQKAAYAAWRERARSAMQEFEAACESVPPVLTPAWLAAQYGLAEEADERDAITYLRRLVLWRMASGQIEHPQECAAIVMPEGERPYSSGR